MGKLNRVKKNYQKGGVSKVAVEVWKYLLKLDGVREPALQTLGNVNYEKLLLAPELGYWPRIENPRTFSEKILHRKHCTSDDRYITVADKWTGRDYVTDRVGEDVCNEVYHMATDPDTIPFDDLPEEFVIKVSPGSEWVLVIDDKSATDFDEIREQCAEWLDAGFGEDEFEYWYTQMEPKILVENRLYGVHNDIPLDYKLFTFHGRVEYIEVDFDRFKQHTRRIYDRDWNPTGIKYGYPIGGDIDKPDCLDEMINIAETLGEEFEFIRIDLFQTKDHGVIVSELTLAPESGRKGFRPRSADFEFGKLW